MSDVKCWLAHSLVRVFPATAPSAARDLSLDAARGDRVSFQVCAHNGGMRAAAVEVEAAVGGALAAIVRRVGCVPVRHFNTETEEAELDGVGYLPGYAPDPLYADGVARVGPLETQAWWVTVTVPEDALAGVADVAVEVRVEGEEPERMFAQVDVSPIVLQPADGFPVTHWFYADALCDWYGCEPFDERFWRIVRPYMADLVAHGGNCQYVPLFTPPTDGVKRPTQLLRVTESQPGRYAFDFTDVARWLRTARECGARWFEWTHLFTQWGVRSAIRVYRSNADAGSLLWPPETAATSPVYRGFLAQLLPAFRSFLEAENALGCSFFHVSDEPGGDHLEDYRAARDMLRELAPWMRVCDALSHVEFGKLGLTDIPIPHIGAARDYREAGIPSWVYFCCGPRGRFLNRLIDTPLAKIRMAGWLFHRFKAQGFLHWGYNYWYRSQTQQLIDPFTEQSGDAWPGWAYGDPFVVYPGQDGPLDSIRWEVWAESLQDMALLRTVGVQSDDPLLASLQGYDRFPKDPEWVPAARRAVLSR